MRPGRCCATIVWATAGAWLRSILNHFKFFPKYGNREHLRCSAYCPHPVIYC